MKNKTQGFTLIELLIVIAIIGILAAVLIPNLLNARNVATNRAAQAFAQNVYKAGNAYLAEDTTRTTGTGFTATCSGTAAYVIGSYSVPAAGAGIVAGCVITPINTTNFTVAVTSAAPGATVYTIGN